MLDRKQESISKKEAYQKNIPDRKEKAIKAVVNLKELLHQLKKKALSDTVTPIYINTLIKAF